MNKDEILYFSRPYPTDAAQAPIPVRAWSENLRTISSDLNLAVGQGWW